MKQFLLLFLLSLFAYAGFTQEKPPHPKSITQGEDGRIYINKHLGVYLYIGKESSPSDSLMRLKSKRHEAVTNPFYFDTEGINTIRSPWAVDPDTKKYLRPQQDVTFEVYADGQAPQSYAYIDGRRASENTTHSISSADDLTLDATDGVSGVKAIYYSVNGNDFQRYSGSIALDEGKAYTIKFYAVDLVGNDEALHTIKVTIDQDAPETSLKTGGTTYQTIFSSNGSLLLEAQDALTGVAAIYYRIDSSSYTEYEQPLRMKNLEEGAHTINYYAVDNAGNKEQAVTYNFFVDKTPPRIVQQIVGDQYYANGKAYSSGRSKLKITAVDNKAGVKDIYYQINNGERKPYKEPFMLPASKGSLQIKAYAVDSVENSSKASVQNQEQFKVTYRDLTGPSLSHRYSGPKVKRSDTLHIGPETRLRFFISDQEAGAKKITYRMDDDEKEKPYNQPLQIKEEGFHTLTVTGYDNVNNTTIKTLTFRVDNKGPKIIYHFSIAPVKAAANAQDTLVYPKYSKLFLAATDWHTGVDNIYYRLRKDAEKKTYKAPIDAFYKTGLYQMEIIAEDKLGNISRKRFPLNIVP